MVLAQMGLVGKRLLTTVFMLCAAVSASEAATGDRLDRSRLQLTFSSAFDRPLSWCGDTCTGQTWRTRYFHSGNAPLSRGLGTDGESEIYMDQTYLGLGFTPFGIVDDKLSITAAPASAGLGDVVRTAWGSNSDPAGERPAPRFTSGILTTEKSYSQLYGYFEARMKLPATPGSWPAFWLLGAPGTRDEIDVLECLCGQPTRQYAGHQWGPIGPNVSNRLILQSPDLSQSFHVFGALWTAAEIIYYRDDIEIGRFANPGLHAPMYLLVNLGMDGSWNRREHMVADPGATATLLVDYIHAYQIE